MDRIDVKVYAGYAMFMAVLLLLVVCFGGCAPMNDAIVKSSIAHYLADHPKQAGEVFKASTETLKVLPDTGVSVTMLEIENEFLSQIKGRDLLPEDVELLKSVVQEVSKDWYNSNHIGDLDPILQKVKVRDFLLWLQNSSARYMLK